MYRALVSRQAQKAFLARPKREALRVKEAIEKLMDEPLGRGTIKLTTRIGDGLP